MKQHAHVIIDKCKQTVIFTYFMGNCKGTQSMRSMASTVPCGMELPLVKFPPRNWKSQRSSLRHDGVIWAETQAIGQS
jgi:hypothetical protein